MGTKRRQSSDRALQRVSVPSQERETLLPCPACEGAGKRLTEKDDGTYSMLRCVWCESNGFVDHSMFKMYRRWQRILGFNRERCRATKGAGPASA